MAVKSVKFELIVGLGNPGAKYSETRHNAGFWFLDLLAREFGANFRAEGKFLGDTCSVRSGGHELKLLKPSTFMNRSGQSVAAMARYYKIPVENVLVVHDELDLAPGTIRLKHAGGHGGHNGLRDIKAHFSSANFWRLRVGVGHPGHKDKVVGYVLERASKADQVAIDESIDAALRVMPELLQGNVERVMQDLHTRK